MPDPGQKSIEVPEVDRETAARMQEAARMVSFLVAAAGSWLKFTLGQFESGQVAIIDGEPAFDGAENLDLVSWTRERLQVAADGPLREASATLVCEAETDQATALARYIREDYRGFQGSKPEMED